MNSTVIIIHEYKIIHAILRYWKILFAAIKKRIKRFYLILNSISVFNKVNEIFVSQLKMLPIFVYFLIMTDLKNIGYLDFKITDILKK